MTTRILTDRIRGSAPRLAVLAALLIGVLGGTGSAPAAGDGAPVLIAAASSLRFAFAELVQAFARGSDAGIKVSFGSSGNFSRQIQQGAPYEIFFSADERSIENLVKADITRGQGDVYALGRIVLFAAPGSPIAGRPGLKALGEAVAANTIKRFAIANPDHAPYGHAAREALASAGLWEQMRPRIVLGENVAQAAQFATSGSADGGIFAHSIAKAGVVGGTGGYALLPETLHAPIRQRMVLLKRATAKAAAFYAFMKGPVAGEILAQHGFAPPVGN